MRTRTGLRRPVRSASVGQLHGLGPLRRAVAVARVAVAGLRRDRANEMEILAALHQHSPAGFDQHPPVRIGEAGHFDGALVNHHLRRTLGIHLDPEFGAAHRNRRGGTIHPVRIRLSREVIDLHPHHAECDAEELAQ